MATQAELAKLVAEAKAKVAEGSALVALCQRRVEKFHRKWLEARRERNKPQKAGKPKRKAYFQAKMVRNKRKTRLWAGREADAIEFTQDWKAALARRRKKLAALQPRAGKLVEVSAKYDGTNEGSTLQRRWASNLGYSSYLPWCSIFVANMLIEAGICTKAQLPTNPAYSGAWIGWGGGRRVNLSERQPGDLLIFDWGDGGITDHVAIYIGNNKHRGGNQSDQVNVRSTPLGNVVAVVRPL